MATKKKLPNVIEELDSYEELKLALEEVTEKKAEIARLSAAAGIPKLEARIDFLKKMATDYALAEGIERVDFAGAHATLVQQHFDGRFIGTDEDIRGEEQAGVIPLRQIIRKKFKGDAETIKAVWSQVTRRIVDKDAVEEAISKGILTVDEVAPSYVERAKAPYFLISKD